MGLWKWDGPLFPLFINENRYTKNKTLYIDKETCKPTKLEIKDNNEKTTVYILYNEVEINSTKKEDVIAFEMNNKRAGIWKKHTIYFTSN